MQEREHCAHVHRQAALVKQLFWPLLNNGIRLVCLRPRPSLHLLACPHCTDALPPLLPLQQAEHMMDMAECKDDRLTLDQMLAVPHAFYGVVHDHDEL